MLNEIEREKRRAEHLLYVSLKYAKTCDVILNLIERWKHMIEICIDMLLKIAKKRKMIKIIPTALKIREELVMELFKEDIVQQTIKLYRFYRRVPDMEKIKEHEFRKNVVLRLIDLETSKETEVDMDKLKEWHAVMDSFLKFIRNIGKKYKIKSEEG